MTDLHAQIVAALETASALDAAAREYRKRAGALLIQAREQNPLGRQWHQGAGLDQRTAELLIELATGERTHVPR